MSTKLKKKTSIAKWPKIFKDQRMIDRVMKKHGILNLYTEEELMTQTWINRTIAKYKKATELSKLNDPQSFSEENKCLLEKYTIFKTRKGQKDVLAGQIPSDNETKGKIVRFISFEEGMHYLKRAHLSTDHGNRKKMKQYVLNNPRWKFIMSPHCYNLFFDLEVCYKCYKIESQSNKVIAITNEVSTSDDICNDITKTIVSVDVLTMPKNDNFNHILVVKYERSNFIQLRPLTTEGPNELFTELFKIFMDLCLPNTIIIRSQTNVESYEEIVGRLCSTTNAEIELRLEQSIRSSLELKQIVTFKLVEWMKREDTECWSIGCNFVQLDWNCTHDTYGLTPFIKMFKYTHINYAPSRSISVSKVNTEQETPAPSIIYLEDEDSSDKNITTSKEVAETITSPIVVPTAEPIVKDFCLHCNFPIHTKVYECSICNRKFHLYCCTQTLDKEKAVIVSVCHTCKAKS